MNVNKLVEEIVKPFLEEDTNLQYDNSVPAEENKDNYPLGECGIIRRALSWSPEESIQIIGREIDDDTLRGFASQYSDDKGSWEKRNQEMATKLGYDLIDYIDGDSKDDVSITLDDEHKFMDVSGTICEEYSVRDKIKHRLKKKIIKESNVSNTVDGGTRDIAPFASWNGFMHFLNDKVTVNRDYKLAKDVNCIEKYVYGNTEGSENGSFNILEVIRKLDIDENKVKKIYQEFITNAQDSHLHADDGSEDEIRSGEIGKGNSHESGDGTPSIKPQDKTPTKDTPGHGGIIKKHYKVLPSNMGKYTNTPKNKLINTN